jgi:exosome complex RNA-binding protein Rrp42 (RNase PH superfamily)
MGGFDLSETARIENQKDEVQSVPRRSHPKRNSVAQLEEHPVPIAIGIIGRVLVLDSYRDESQRDHQSRLEMVCFFVLNAIGLIEF